MKTWKIRYGLRQVERQVPDTTTLQQVVNDQDVRAQLGGYSDNVSVAVDGCEAALDESPDSGAEVVLTSRCNTKAS